MESQRATGAPGAALPRKDPGGPHRRRSKMLDAYLSDVEYLMRERLWDEAVPLALALPHICVALSDSELCSSRARYLQWCESWVRPARADSCLNVPSPDAIHRLTREGTDADPSVPTHALRRLRLRRLSRAAPRRRAASLGLLRLEAAQQPDREACFALLEAVQRWYADHAAHDRIVQGNLARLAVLR